MKTLAKRGETGKRLRECELPVGDDLLHLCALSPREIEKRLLDSLRKPADGLISRWINRPVSLTFTRLLMNTRLRPNHVSLVTLTLGALSGIFVSFGTHGWGILGALALQAQSVLDGVDGELSRLRFQGSRLGQWLDTISDDLADFSFLMGCTWIQPSPEIRWIGIAGLISFAAAQTILYYTLATVYRCGDLQAMSWNLGPSKGWIEGVRFLFRHDFICLMAIPLALVGRLDIAVVFLSAGRIVVLSVTLRQAFLKGFAKRETP